jgi:DNA-binding response OmpR family regulator
LNSPRVLILAEKNEDIRELLGELTQEGYDCDIVQSEEELANGKSGDILIIEVGNRLNDITLSESLQRIKQELHAPIILITDKKTLHGLEYDSNVDDFILKPCNLAELSLRLKWLLRKNKNKESTEILIAGDIAIDLSRCEVIVAGKVVDLTFTEYELLKLLIYQKGRVLTRDELLNKIWGYDYFGGDRTVDVHITRLRNKIEDTRHTFIETVRNIGYRIKVSDEFK